MISLKTEILKRFRSHWRENNNQFRNAQVVEDYVHKNILHPKKGTQYKHETIGRCLRKLAEDGQLEQDYQGNAQSVAYRYKPSEQEILGANMRAKLNV